MLNLKKAPSGAFLFLSCSSSAHPPLAACTGDTHRLNTCNTAHPRQSSRHPQFRFRIPACPRKSRQKEQQTCLAIQSLQYRRNASLSPPDKLVSVTVKLIWHLQQEMNICSRRVCRVICHVEHAADERLPYRHRKLHPAPATIPAHRVPAAVKNLPCR